MVALPERVDDKESNESDAPSVDDDEPGFHIMESPLRGVSLNESTPHRTFFDVIRTAAAAGSRSITFPRHSLSLICFMSNLTTLKYSLMKISN